MVNIPKAFSYADLAQGPTFVAGLLQDPISEVEVAKRCGSPFSPKWRMTRTQKEMNHLPSIDFQGTCWVFRGSLQGGYGGVLKSLYHPPIFIHELLVSGRVLVAFRFVSLENTSTSRYRSTDRCASSEMVPLPRICQKLCWKIFRPAFVLSPICSLGNGRSSAFKSWHEIRPLMLVGSEVKELYLHWYQIEIAWSFLTCNAVWTCLTQVNLISPSKPGQPLATRKADGICG